MKFWIFVCLIFGFSVCIAADDPLVLIESGNKSLAQKKYAEAVAAYTAIDITQYNGFGLCMNLGIAYAGLNKYPLSILYYEKALKISPNDKTVASDLKIVRSKVAALEDGPEQNILLRSWSFLTGMVSGTIWAVMSILILMIIGFLIVKFSVVERLEKKMYRYLIGLGLVFLFSFVAASYRTNQTTSHKVMIILEDGVSLKTGPDSTSPDVQALPAGSKVFITDHLKEWVMVTSEYGDTGWVLLAQGQTI